MASFEVYQARILERLNAQGIFGNGSPQQLLLDETRIVWEFGDDTEKMWASKICKNCGCPQAIHYHYDGGGSRCYVGVRGGWDALTALKDSYFLAEDSQSSEDLWE